MYIISDIKLLEMIRKNFIVKFSIYLVQHSQSKKNIFEISY
jgi:hypothetical protein